MILDDVLSNIKGLETDDLVPYISENLDVLITDFKQMSDMLKFDISTIYNLFENYIILCVGADGNIDDDEYHFYEVLMDFLEMPPKGQQDISMLAGKLYDDMSRVEELISTLAEFYKFLDNKYEYRKALLALTGAILQFNGTLENQEMDLLNYVNQILNEKCGPETSSGFNMPNQSSGNKGFNVSNLNNSGSALGTFSNSITEEELYIKDFGCCYKKYYNGYAVSVGAIIINPNKNSVALNVNVKIIYKDANGRIIDSCTKRIYFIDANTEFYFGAEYDVNRLPSTVDVLVDCDDFDAQPSTGPLASDFVFNNYSMDTDEYGDVEFSATVQNPYNKTIDLEVYSVFFDENDNITGGLDSHAYDLFKNSEDSFNREVDSGVTGKRVKSSAAFYLGDIF